MSLKTLLMVVFMLTQTHVFADVIQRSAQTGEIRDLLAADSAVVYAATFGGGLYKSNDGGLSWSRLAALPARYIHRLAGSGSVLYAASTSGLYKSSDGGATWSLRLFDPVTVVALNPFNANQLLVGINGAGLYRSTDGAATFTNTVAGLDSLDFIDLLFDPAANTGVAYVATRNNPHNPALNIGGVFKSADGGASWVNWNNGLPNKFVSSLAVDSTGALLAGTMDPRDVSGGIYRKVGEGAWSLARNLFGVYTLRRDANNPAILWAGTRAVGVWRSLDNGLAWQQAVDPGVNPDVLSGIYALATLPGQPRTVLAAVKGYGLFRSETAQATNSLQISPWVFTGNGLKADRVMAFTGTAVTTNFYMGLKSGGAWQSTDGGSTWKPVNSGLNIGFAGDLIRGVTQLSASSNDPNLIYAASGGNDLLDAGQPLSLFRWNGAAWSQVIETGVPQSFSNQVGLVVSPFDNNTVFYSLFPGSDPNYGLFRRQANSFWQVSATSNILGLKINGSVIPSVLANKFFLISFDDLPYFSNDNGISWVRINASTPGFSRLEFLSIAEKPTAPNIVVAATNNGVYRSVDGGGSFFPVTTSGLRRLVLSSLQYSADGRLFGADYAGYYYCSNNDGVSWITKNTLPAAITQVKRSGSSLSLLTDGAGVYRDDNPTCP